MMRSTVPGYFASAAALTFAAVAPVTARPKPAGPPCGIRPLPGMPGGPAAEVEPDEEPDAPAIAEAPNAMAASAATPATALRMVFDMPERVQRRPGPPPENH